MRECQPCPGCEGTRVEITEVRPFEMSDFEMSDLDQRGGG